MEEKNGQGNTCLSIWAPTAENHVKGINIFLIPTFANNNNKKLNFFYVCEQIMEEKKKEDAMGRTKEYWDGSCQSPSKMLSEHHSNEQIC